VEWLCFHNDSMSQVERELFCEPGKREQQGKEDECMKRGLCMQWVGFREFLPGMIASVESQSLKRIKLGENNLYLSGPMHELGLDRRDMMRMFLCGIETEFSVVRPLINGQNYIAFVKHPGQAIDGVTENNIVVFPASWRKEGLGEP
jgi:hypothetical protein